MLAGCGGHWRIGRVRVDEAQVAIGTVQVDAGLIRAPTNCDAAATVDTVGYRGSQLLIQAIGDAGRQVLQGLKVAVNGRRHGVTEPGVLALLGHALLPPSLAGRGAGQMPQPSIGIL